MPYADPEKNRECRRQYKRSARGRLLAKEWLHARYTTDPEFKKRMLADGRRYTARHPEKIRIKNANGRVIHAISIRNSNLRKLYGITHADYERMLLEQKGRCAICGDSSPGSGKKHFSVDHNHVTNKVRQLLCDPCNNGLGRFKDDLERLRKAVAYLEKHVEGTHGRQV